MRSLRVLLRAASLLALTTLLLLAALSALPARAAELYLTGDLGIAGGGGDASGTLDGGTFTIPVDGSDTDSSSAWGGALGFGVGLDEVMDEVWGLELPSWTLRVEVSGLAGRDWELLSEAGDTFFSDVKGWSAMTNLWLDLPLQAPVGWIFGRVPVLAPLSLYGGGGVGVASFDVDTTNNVVRGSESTTNFAWQGGAGLAYELTEWVTLSAGYRYHSMGSVETALEFAPGAPAGSHELDLSAHEFVTSLRVDFFAAPLEDFSPTRWSLPRLPNWLVPGR